MKLKISRTLFPPKKTFWMATMLATLPWLPSAVLAGNGKQDDGTHRVPLSAITGTWDLYPQAEGTSAPPPPPVYASYRTRKKLASGKSVPRVILKSENGRLSGTAVFPEGIVLTDDNRDVTGKPETDLRDPKFDGVQLIFRAQVGEEVVEARLKFEKGRFRGTWRVSKSGRTGPLFMVRR
ncbi:MAG: hypothetical protein ACE5JX_14130 [Acidobacteriota bacterium]